MKWKYTIYLLTLVMLTVWLAVLFYPQQYLQIITCDVGQGDATLLIHGKKQILIDGGPNNKVVDCIDRYMPFWDRSIEFVVLTHLEKDHFLGLIEVFERYSVQVLLATGLDNSSNEYQVLKTTIGGKGVAVANPKDVVKMRLGMIHLDILHPPDSYLKDVKVVSKGDSTADVLGVYSTSRDANDFSIVNLVKYGNFRALITGDIMQDATADLLKNNGMQDVNYIKAPHHGSKNGLTESLLNAVKPEIAVIPVGKNSYGHPHKEILELLEDNNIRVLQTEMS